MMSYPNDADGAALRRLADRCDMSEPMDIDFVVSVPDQAAGEELARLVTKRGYTPSVEFDEEAEEWTCYCAKRMVPTYEAVVAAQQELDELGAEVGGYSDGWGTFGD
ncbi:ribonuclease E inhibitor RraB [Polyangium mundeleinium]|uniref:Ribonuclease E inhibitor RraB n=1 Tax=Polyangium mundeleinium TaxID=2995306 RepID=A0ABT5ERE5_9BACT|nr:ribonuclease E inhibitor RraB [Polyangium mundeleinium]MDC0743291.1 ribonuclease E inhibitor RraB [Polyangium mundeleinium]